MAPLFPAVRLESGFGWALTTINKNSQIPTLPGLAAIPSEHQFESLYIYTMFQDLDDPFLSQDQIRLIIGSSSWLTAINNDLEKARIIATKDFQLAWDINIVAEKRFRKINILTSDLLEELKKDSKNLMKKYHWTFPLQHDSTNHSAIFVPAEQQLIDFVFDKHKDWETVLIGFGGASSVNLVEDDLHWQPGDSDDDLDNEKLSLKSLGNLSELKEHYINKSLYDVVDMDALASCPKLELVHVGEYDTFTDLNWVAGIPNLKSLKIDFFDLDLVEDPQTFRTWKSLEVIHLLGIPTRPQVKQLMQCPRLKRIIIEYEKPDSIEPDRVDLLAKASTKIELKPVEYHDYSIPEAFTKHRERAKKRQKISQAFVDKEQLMQVALNCSGRGGEIFRVHRL